MYRKKYNIKISTGMYFVIKSTHNSFIFILLLQLYELLYTNTLSGKRLIDSKIEKCR